MRKIIHIDEDKCDGCGLCVIGCPESALQIVDGKARLASEKYCDGLGACLGECPKGAISIEERDAEDFDEAAVKERLQEIGKHSLPHSEGDTAHSPHACPSARTQDFRGDERGAESDAPGQKQESELRQWPIKLSLVNPQAPYFQEAELLLAADCAPFAYASTHSDFLRGKALVIGCPKLDDLEYYQEKLTDILKQNNIWGITVLHMEVPCCGGLLYLAEQAVKAAGKAIAIKVVVVSLRGDIEGRGPATG